MSSLINIGYMGMFLSALLAATILPFSSEVVLLTLYTNGLSPVFLLLVASLGNVLGSLINYALGYRYGEVVATRWLRVNESSFTRAQNTFTRWGQWSLFLCWVPIVGDPITLVAGVLRSNFIFFLCSVAISKTARYGLLLYFLS